MISDVVTRVADILSSSEFDAALSLVMQSVDVNLPRMQKVYRHSVQVIDQFPAGFVLWDGIQDFLYVKNSPVLHKHRLFVGVAVRANSPEEIDNTLRGYCDALRPVLNANIGDGNTIVDGRVVQIDRDPIEPAGRSGAPYVSSFTMIVEVSEYADAQTVS